VDRHTTAQHPHRHGIVLHADRGLDVFQSCVNSKRLASGRPAAPRTSAFDRDLRIRDRETRRTPPVFSVWHRHRRIFYNPNTLSKREAIRRYDVAHP
jgi:hypothetical protein